MAKVKITNYYHPDICTAIRIQSLKETQETMTQDEEKLEDEDEDENHASYGLADPKTRNLEYNHILEDVVSHEESVTEASARILKKCFRVTDSVYRQPQPSHHDNQSEISVIFKRFYLNQPIEFISSQDSISEEKVKKVCNKFKSRLRTRNRENKKRLNKATRLEEYHKAAIKSFLEANKLRQFTLQSIKNDLSRRFPELMSISKPTISKCIRKDYSMRYKRLSKVNSGMISLERKELTKEAITILGTLEAKGTEVIYIDEFTVSERSYKPYGWSCIRQKECKLMPNDNFCMGFIVGLSSELTYGVMGVKGTTDSRVFITYLRELTKHIESRRHFSKSRYVLCCDNASYHKSESVQKFLK